jgi:hypothetical protein
MIGYHRAKKRRIKIGGLDSPGEKEGRERRITMEDISELFFNLQLDVEQGQEYEGHALMRGKGLRLVAVNEWSGERFPVVLLKFNSVLL